MASLRIHLLGPFRVFRNGQPLDANEWRSLQVRTILKLLLTRQGHVVSTDQLLDVLWPDDDLQTARRRLHVRMSQLRRALDPERRSAHVLAVEGGYTLNPESDYWLDTVEFEARAQWGRRCQENDNPAQAITAYETARALYRGDLLIEDLYADWTLVERERLRERFLTVLTELAECYARQGRYRRAITRCREVLAADPHRESIYLRLMLYHYYAGEQGQALQAYERCRQTLADELGAEPLPQTTALYEKIRRQQVELAYPAPVYEERPFQTPHTLRLTPFVGREEEYAWLIAGLRRATTGDGKVMSIVGEAGLGKTRLAQEALVHVREQGTLTLSSRCHEVEADLPYQPLIEALQPLATGQDALSLKDPRQQAELERLFSHLYYRGPVGSLSEQGQRRHLFEAVSQLLNAAAAVQPVVIFIDGVQWADAGSLALLSHLMRRAVGLPIGWLVTYRPEEVSSNHSLQALLDALRRDGRLAEKGLRPLPPDTVIALVARMANDLAPDPALSERLARESMGNPFYLVSILENLFEEGALAETSSGSWTLSRDLVGKASELMLPPTLRKTLERRLDRLEPIDRRVFEAAAVIGHPFDFDLLQLTSNVDEDDLLDTLDRLIEGRLLSEWFSPDYLAYDMSHNKLRRVTYDRIKGVRRRRLHQRAAEALLSLYGDSPAISAELAYHSHRGGRPAAAVQFAIQAGEHALQLYAGQQAVNHLQDAVKWAEEADLSLDKEHLAAIHSNWGRALQLSGRYDEALTHLEQALPLVQGERKREIIFWICQMEAIYTGSLGKFSRLVPALEQELAGDSDKWALAALCWTQGYLATIQGQLTRAREYLTAGWRMARQLTEQGDKAPPLVKAEGYVTLADCHERWADWRRTLVYAERAMSTFTAQNDLSGIANSHVLLQAACYGLGEWDRAMDHFEQCYSLAVEAGDLGMQGHALYGAGRLCLERGDWVTAEKHAHRILAAAEASGDVVRRGFGQLLLARLAMRQGAPQKAISTLQSLENQARAANALVYVVQLLRYLAQAELLSGESQEALLTAQDGIELARRCGYKREWGGLLRILGEALAQSGERQEAEQRLLEALALAGRIGCRYDLAQARRSLGKLCGEWDQAKKAREHLAAALALFEDVGAEHDAATTQGLLSHLEPIADQVHPRTPQVTTKNENARTTDCTDSPALRTRKVTRKNQ